MSVPSSTTSEPTVPGVPGGVAPPATKSQDSQQAPGEINASGQWSVVRRLLPYLWPADRRDLKIRIVLALSALVLAKLATVSVPFFYKWAVDTLSGSGADGADAPPADLGMGESVALVAVLLTVGYGVARLLSSGFQQLRDALFARVGQHAERAVSVETFSHMHGLSLRFHLERRTGGLSRIIERGTRAIDFLLRFTLFSIFPTLLELALVCVILAVQFSPVYALVTAVTVISYLGITFRITEWRIKLRRQMNESDQDANTKAIDSLLNFETVKYFNNERYEISRFDTAAAAYETAAIKNTTSLAFLNFAQAAVFTLGMVTLMVMAVRGVISGEFTLGDFVLINTFLLQLAMPLNMVGFVYREIKQSLVDMEKLFGILDLGAEVHDTPGAPPLKVQEGSLCFEKVRFGYDARREILHGLDLSVPGGRTVAIVGPSGAGKSTISRLLYRFYDVTDGRVLIDGQNIADVNQESLRAAIGIVPQDTVLFNDTIAYNIAYGRPGATREEVEAAAKRAEIHDFVTGLPEGYDTMVGERGLKLSGGEKQRVAIARTILKNPPILILDEATSALDSHTEKAIQASLEEISKNRTTLVIAHRLSTVVAADEIIVLVAGDIVERGTHTALLEKGGTYADLWAKQIVEAEEAEGEGTGEPIAP